ncbi:class I SAM-dependent methyltransferase [Planococcus halotolerans]|uniref:SAM-dependent methyltransferase n=1 Tax=Planococcus halotolerans TaxID=2233542 RepID=A0A365L7K1_9BACL|nr:class I SAM-dependent methyltransferase [Planococcus halotolerans]QHJ69934.1 methyltransferase domain-containing protein [Planococcus halotolerans]RAZ81365.1 SAM-dependent methyltransferase [Planococcus halotolerans]
MHEKHCKSHSKHGSHGKMTYLENPARKDDLSPEKLLSLIPIKETDTVLDFGAGTGYFTIPAAKAVAANVYALDMDAEMLEVIKTKALHAEVQNIIPVHTDGSDIPVPDESIDLVIASLVLHEIKPLDQTLTQIKNVLKDGGHLICIELEPKVESSHKAPRISLAGMEQEMKDAGFRIVEKVFPSESLYVLIVQKK